VKNKKNKIPKMPTQEEMLKQIEEGRKLPLPDRINILRGNVKHFQAQADDFMAKAKQAEHLADKSQGALEFAQAYHEDVLKMEADKVKAEKELKGKGDKEKK